MKSFIIAVLAFLLGFLPWYLNYQKRKKAEPLSALLRIVDTLYAAGAPFHGMSDDIKSLVRQQLNYVRANAGERISYTASNGRCYSAGESESLLFALVCIACYAADAQFEDLSEYCDRALLNAEIISRASNSWNLGIASEL